MNDEELAAIRARADAATPGPWTNEEAANVVDFGSPPDAPFAVCHGDDGKTRMNARFIAHARTDVPALLDEVERLRRNRKQLLPYIEKLEEAAP